MKLQKFQSKDPLIKAIKPRAPENLKPPPAPPKVYPGQSKGTSDAKRDG